MDEAEARLREAVEAAAEKFEKETGRLLERVEFRQHLNRLRQPWVADARFVNIEVARLATAEDPA